MNSFHTWLPFMLFLLSTRNHQHSFRKQKQNWIIFTTVTVWCWQTSHTLPDLLHTGAYWLEIMSASLWGDTYDLQAPVGRWYANVRVVEKCSESTVAIFKYINWIIQYSMIWPGDPCDWRNSDPFDTDMQINLNWFQHWTGLLPWAQNYINWCQDYYHQ